MTIEPRAVTALIGPSGCGKSTFLRTLNRMHEVIPGAYADGVVEIDGINIYGQDVDPVGVRRNVGMVFQRPNPFPTMSIRENVIAGQRLNGAKASKSEVDELVDVPREKVGDDPLERLGPVRTTGAVVGHPPSHAGAAPAMTD